MAEYIEKSALMGFIESEARRWGDDYDWWQCLSDIEDFKPADVRPVVRGRWIPFTSEAAGDIWYCSACGVGFAHHMDFCPHCGADMREPNLDTTKGEA
jgi:hypothetical protein